MSVAGGERDIIESAGACSSDDAQAEVISWRSCKEVSTDFAANCC